MKEASSLEFISYVKLGDIYNNFIPFPYSTLIDVFRGGDIGLLTCRRYECFEGIKFLGDKTF